MTTIKAGLLWYLKSKTDVTDIVGAGANARIYDGVAPKGAIDSGEFLILNRIGGEEEDHFTGASGLVMTEFQIDSYARGSVEAEALADVVRSVLHGYPGGEWGSASPITVDQAWISGKLSLLDSPNEGDEEILFREMRQFEIWHRESIPSYS